MTAVKHDAKDSGKLSAYVIGSGKTGHFAQGQNFQ